jgi:hypothetical protein
MKYQYKFIHTKIDELETILNNNGAMGWHTIFVDWEGEGLFVHILLEKIDSGNTQSNIVIKPKGYNLASPHTKRRLINDTSTIKFK